jgi:pilus assembly protein CpaB
MKNIFRHLYCRLKSLVSERKPERKNNERSMQGRFVWLTLMLRRYWMVLAGVCVAAFAFLATQQYAHEKVLAERERVLPKGGFVEVLVAARNLGAGESVTAETIAVRQVPKEWMPSNALRPHEFDSVNQTALSRALDAGSPLTLEYLRQSKTSQNSLSLEPGYRAISIAVDEVSSVGGLIQPGDRVDLWGTALIGAGGDMSQIIQVAQDTAKGSTPAKLVAENLRVIATGQKTERADAEGRLELAAAYSSITLAVPSPVAAAVLGGQFQGRLGIALRSPADSISRNVKRRASAKPQELPVEILIGGVDGGLQ